MPRLWVCGLVSKEQEEGVWDSGEMLTGEVSNEKWFPKLCELAAQDEMSPRGKTQAARNENKQESNPFNMCSDSGLVSEVTGKPLCWVWLLECVMCVCLFTDTPRPCFLLFPLKDMATSALDAGAIRVSKSKTIQPQNGAAQFGCLF